MKTTTAAREGWNQERFLDVLRRRGYETATKPGAPRQGTRATGPVLAKLLEINITTARKLLAGTHAPQRFVVARAALALDVSADWLMGLSEIERRL